MTPETKAWVEAMKTSVREYPGAKDIHRFIEIIESQEKEIERAIVHLNKVLEDEESRPGAWGPDVTCVRYIKTAKDILEAL